jgi:hypothetical protein
MSGAASPYRSSVTTQMAASTASAATPCASKPAATRRNAHPLPERSDGIARPGAGLTEDMHRVTEGFELRHQWLDAVAEVPGPGRIIDQKGDCLSVSPSQLEGNVPEGFSIPRG